MDEHFHNVTFDIINRFLEKISDQCQIDVTLLWSLWKEMFNFPVKTDKKTKIVKSKKEKEPVKEKTQDLEEKEPVKEKTPVKEPVKEKTQDLEEKEPVHEQPVQVKEKSKSKSKEKEHADTCQFILLRGPRSGTPCGKPVSKKCADKLCTTHAK